MPSLSERLGLPSRSRPIGPTGNDKKLCPDVKSNWWTALTHGWLSSLLKVGFTRQLQFEDVWPLDEDRLCSTRSKILQDSFYMRCPEELRPHYLRTKPAGPADVPINYEKAGAITPDSKETLNDDANPDKREASHTFTDPFELGKTYSTTLHAPDVHVPRRGSAISQGSAQRDRGRETSFEQATMDLRRGSDAAAFEIDHISGDALSRMVTRVSLQSDSGDSDETMPEKLPHPLDTISKDKKYDQSLVKAMYHTVHRELWWAFGAYTLYSSLLVASTLVTRQLLQYITSAYNHVHGSGPSPPGVGTGVGYAVGLFAMQQGAYLAINFCSAHERQAGWILRMSVWDSVACKSFRLSPRARLEMTRGKLVTLISADCSLIEQALPWVTCCIIDPIIVVAAAAILIYMLGVSALVGVGLLMACSPSTGYLVKKLLQVRRDQLHLLDRRTALMNEVLASVRSVKLYAYGSYFVRRILVFRDSEMKCLKRYNTWRVGVIGLLNVAPVLATVLTFITYSLTGHDLDIATIFSSLQLFNVIAQPMRTLPVGIASVMDGYVASKRVKRGLLAEDMPHGLQIDQSSAKAIQIDGTFTFETSARPGATLNSDTTAGKERKRDKVKRTIARQSKSEEKQCKVPDDLGEPFQLENFHLSVPRGSLVCVVGRVGSGKSALCQALLGEMRPTTGRVLFSGSVGYFQQEPWIQSCSLRENILFGEPEDLPRLAATIRACALEPDIAALDDGLEAEIGERGVTLSGGQKARLQLARVVYSNPEIIILDDPLAAVDSHVAKHLTEDCIRGVLASKTVVLVTHHLDVLPKADIILVLQDGQVVQQGSYRELVERDGTFRDLIADFGDAAAEEEDAEHDAEGVIAAASDTVADQHVPNPVAPISKSQGKGARIFEDEDRFSGSISWNTYKTYARYMGSYWWTAAILGLLSLSQISMVATQLMLGFWTSNAIPEFRVGDYIAVYGALGVSQGVIILIVCPIFVSAGLRASFRLFQEAIQGVLRSPLSFHDRNPLGRIISRLSKDVEMVDTYLAWQVYFFLQPLLSIVGALGLVIYTYSWLGFLFIPIMAVYLLTALFYKRSSVEIKRMDNLMRSFVYSTFSEQLSGMACIRSHQRENYFITKFRRTVDEECRLFHVQVVLQKWLGMRVGFYGNILVLAVALFGVGFRERISPAKLGVVLTYTISVVQSFSQLISEFVLLENSFNYVERILHYANLPQEAPAAMSVDDKLGKSWPMSGKVDFENVKMRYREGLPLVLKGISFSVQPGEKVGIVGRTGAGKSSLLQVLLRLVELTEGRILVDGQDLAALGLDYLRTQLSAIPQDSLLFQGTMRENLDPAGEHSDAHLHEVLRKCELIAEGDDVAPYERKRLEKFRLDADITTNGENFSGGEKQLLALARAIVKDSRVILLDEATASVDPETDATFQKTIRTQFKHHTILCIAHRLQTVAFYDKILVLDAGIVSEFGAPLDLFDQDDSVFRSMCDAARLDREGIEKIRAAEA